MPSHGQEHVTGPHGKFIGVSFGDELCAKLGPLAKDIFAVIEECRNKGDEGGVILDTEVFPGFSGYDANHHSSQMNGVSPENAQEVATGVLQARNTILLYDRATVARFMKAVDTHDTAASRTPMEDIMKIIHGVLTEISQKHDGVVVDELPAAAHCIYQTEDADGIVVFTWHRVCTPPPPTHTQTHSHAPPTTHTSRMTLMTTPPPPPPTHKE